MAHSYDSIHMCTNYINYTPEKPNMKNQFELDKALELSPTRRALRVAPMGDLWLVQEGTGDYPYTLTHLFNSTGYPGDPYAHKKWQFRTLDELQTNESILDTWLSDHDWFPDNDETRKMFPNASEMLWLVS